MAEFLRNDLKALKPYKVRSVPYKIKLDANESPYDLPEAIRQQLVKELMEGCQFNRYPDSDATALRQAISRYCGVSPDEVMVGAGSDELIRVIISAFVGKGDGVLCPSPSFTMYGIFTHIAGGIPVEVPLDDNFDYDVSAFYKAIEQYKPRVVFICSPNNPTGNVIDKDELMKLIKAFNGVVVVDEAYGEFCGDSIADQIVNYPNALVLKTFSKAFGLAGLRVGYLIGNRKLVEQVYAVKPPYNLNSFSQKAAQLVLENIDLFRSRIASMIHERERLYDKLRGVKGIEVYPSKANFLLIKVPDAEMVYKKLIGEGILVRNFPNDPRLKNYLRITVGTRQDNDAFVETLKRILEG
ncbi:histidinol-phosphate transaminase [Caldicoprobacter faecalis]|uniref:Histidinol-phosphate aminotransferase n=1 Tax=Caldicoprobacter faecalis TaxID=937334 RepID=A0A1I5RW13_9FIRM|nr:histidinol-phosphate transaminase [Caldicoprobacter faecalis]SFP62597.1 histidinol-phosphate aminotransferase [Caldicoprobacter faecalis]